MDECRRAELASGEPLPGAGTAAERAVEPWLQDQFASTLVVKDLELAQRASDDEGLATPFGALALERYRDFVAAGNGELDFSAIYRTYVAE